MVPWYGLHYILFLIIIIIGSKIAFGERWDVLPIRVDCENFMCTQKKFEIVQTTCKVNDFKLNP